MRLPKIVATLGLVAVPLVAQQSTILFESDGSSLAPFVCEYSNSEYSPPFVDVLDGLAQPSIEFDTVNGVQLSIVPYVLPSLEPGQVLHGTIDIKAEIRSRAPVLAAFGVAIDPLGCSLLPQTRRPVPEFFYVFDGGLAGNVQTWLTRQGGDTNTPVNTPSAFSELTWHSIDFRLEAQPDGSQTYELKIDGNPVTQGSAYANIGTNEKLGVMIGATASGGPTNVRYDNIKLELLEPVAVSCVGFEPPMASGPVSVGGKNRALPLRAQLLDGNGTPMTDADLASAPVLQVLYDAGQGGQPIDVTDEALPAGQGTEGNEFVFEAPRWRYNLKTKNYSAPGTYHISIVSGDNEAYEISPSCQASFVVE